MTESQVTTTELWREVPDFPAYEVSNLGQVRRRTACRASAAGRILRQGLAPAGYPQVSLVRVKTYTKTVHRLVALAWLGPPPSPGDVVNHKNGIRTDNRVENLEWCSHLENVRHAIQVLGKDRSCERHPRAKLSVSEVVEIHHALMRATPPIEIMATFGISETQLIRIKKRESWKATLAEFPINYPAAIREVRGSRVGTARLVESQVAQIKSMIRANLTNDQIAARFGVSRSTIQFIRCGQTWKHVS